MKQRAEPYRARYLQDFSSINQSINGSFASLSRIPLIYFK